MARKKTAENKEETKVDPKEKALQLALGALEKNLGKGIVLRKDANALPNVEWFSSGCASLNRALSGSFHKGYPRGRIIELFGPECIDADTFIQYEVRTVDGKRQNHKGGTIERLYHRFHNKPYPGPGSYQRPQTKDSIYFAPSVNTEGRIFQNKILNVVDAGEKECFKVTLVNGFSISTSIDHEFFTGQGYKKLKYLSVGDTVYIHTNTPYRGRKAEPKSRPALLVKHHKYAPIKKQYDPIVDKVYKYHRVPKPRAILEAHQNGLTLEEYSAILNSDKWEQLEFIHPELHVHHRDNDWTNNSIINLELMTAEQHGRHHAEERHNNLRFVACPTEIESIISVGKRHTYDLTMEHPANNYIANGVVVHNSSGKTTISLHAIAEIQKRGELAAFVDVEHALDPLYATSLGVDMDALLLSQPNCGEDALNVVSHLTKSGAVSLIVVDSVAALVPKAELEGEIGDSHVGRQARLMGQAMRMLCGPAEETNTTIIFINQIRLKVGVMFGNPETTSGGNALKFYSSQRLDIRRTGGVKGTDGDEFIANQTRVKVVKSKVSRPFRKAEFNIVYGEGIDTVADIINLAVEAKIVEKSGSWYSYTNERLGQGLNNATKALKEAPEILEEIYNRLG